VAGGTLRNRQDTDRRVAPYSSWRPNEVPDREHCVVLTVFAVRGAKAWAIITILILAVVGLGWWLAARASSLRTTLAHANARKVLLLHVGTEPSSLDPHQNRGIPESKSSAVYLRVSSFRIRATARSNFPELLRAGSTMKIPQCGHFISGLTPDGPTVIHSRQTILLFLSSGSLPLDSALSSPIICISSAAAKISTKER